MKRFALALALAGVLATAAMAADAAAGKALFATKCKTCHGADGQGNAGMAKMLKVDIKPLSAAEVQKKSDADLKKAITDGVGKMKPVAGVSGAEADNIVAHIRSLKK